MEKQSYANHRQWVPGYHFILPLLALVALAGASINFYRALSYQSGRTAGAVIILLVICVILFAGSTLGDNVVDPLYAFMGAALLAYGVRQGYAQSTAEKELIKQYDFMNRVFYNAVLP